ncbi:MAG: hypothetical protein LBV17_02925 [Treponema sp.]|nr:hypothetical protein [Treponema sp.]
MMLIKIKNKAGESLLDTAKLNSSKGRNEYYYNDLGKGNKFELVDGSNDQKKNNVKKR